MLVKQVWFWKLMRVRRRRKGKGREERKGREKERYSEGKRGRK